MLVLRPLSDWCRAIAAAQRVPAQPRRLARGWLLGESTAQRPVLRPPAGADLAYARQEGDIVQAAPEEVPDARNARPSRVEGQARAANTTFQHRIRDDPPQRQGCAAVSGFVGVVRQEVRRPGLVTQQAGGTAAAASRRHPGAWPVLLKNLVRQMPILTTKNAFTLIAMRLQPHSVPCSRLKF